MRRFCKMMTAAVILPGMGACSMLPKSPHRHPEKPTAQTAVKPAPRTSSGTSLWPPWKILERKRMPPPPKAFPLQAVGTIRSISHDESYAIVELAPGMLVRTGDALIVTSQGHQPGKLKVAEVQPPCFAAEIKEGTVCAGDIVKR